MRAQWIVSILSTLLSMGLLVIIMGQYQELNMLDKGEGKLKKEAKRLDNQYMNEDLMKMTMEKLLVQGKKVVESLEESLTKLSPEMEKKKKESDSCEAEKKTIGDDLAASEKEYIETEASLKAESDAWNQEINILNQQLKEYRPICDHVKQVSHALKLCGPKPS